MSDSSNLSVRPLADSPYTDQPPRGSKYGFRRTDHPARPVAQHDGRSVRGQRPRTSLGRPEQVARELGGTLPEQPSCGPPSTPCFALGAARETSGVFQYYYGTNYSDYRKPARNPYPPERNWPRKQVAEEPSRRCASHPGPPTHFIDNRRVSERTRAVEETCRRLGATYQVRMTTFGDEGATATRVLPGILKRLKTLDIGYGNMDRRRRPRAWPLRRTSRNSNRSTCH